MHYLNEYLTDCTSKSDNGGPFVYKQCNMQGTRILFNQAPIVQSAQNLVEITFAAVVGVSKKMN